MNKTLIAAAAVVLSLTAAPAFAQDMSNPTVYGSIGYAQIEDDFVSLGGAQLRLGARFTPNFGVEAEGTIGLVDDDLFGVDVDLERQIGVYGVVFLPMSENTDFIARVGYSNFEIGVPGGSADEDTVNYGVGLQHRFDEKNGIRGDYTRMDGDSGEADMWSIAYVRTF